MLPHPDPNQFQPSQTPLHKFQHDHSQNFSLDPNFILEELKLNILNKIKISENNNPEIQRKQENDIQDDKYLQSKYFEENKY